MANGGKRKCVFIFCDESSDTNASDVVNTHFTNNGEAVNAWVVQSLGRNAVRKLPGTSHSVSHLLTLFRNSPWVETIFPPSACTIPVVEGGEGLEHPDRPGCFCHSVRRRFQVELLWLSASKQSSRTFSRGSDWTWGDSSKDTFKVQLRDWSPWHNPIISVQTWKQTFLGLGMFMFSFSVICTYLTKNSKVAESFSPKLTLRIKTLNGPVSLIFPVSLAAVWRVFHGPES